MSLEIRVRVHRGATVVSLDGTAAAGLLEPMRDALAAAVDDAPLLVLDLDGLVVNEPGALRSVLVHILESVPDGRLRLAAGRPRSIEHLVAGHLPRHLPVHASVDDAVSTHLRTTARTRRSG